jgi:hypothetical protein
MQLGGSGISDQEGDDDADETAKEPHKSPFTASSAS